MVERRHVDGGTLNPVGQNRFKALGRLVDELNVREAERCKVNPRRVRHHGRALGGEKALSARKRRGRMGCD